VEFAIPVDPSTFTAYYPLVTQAVVTTRPKTSYAVALQDPGGSLAGELDSWVTELKNENPNYTTCCIQMSHAINMAFHLLDTTKMVGEWSIRRKTRGFKIAAAANKEFHYIASVDEMKGFLNNTFGEGEVISRRGDGKPASRDEAKSSIKGRPGIVVFMNNQPSGLHTEIWTGDDFHQGWMKGRMDPFNWAPVWFWDIGLPRPDNLPPV
jgi:hypothetical protein